MVYLIIEYVALAFKVANMVVVVLAVNNTRTNEKNNYYIIFGLYIYM